MRPPEGMEELKEAPPRKATLLEDLVALLPLSSGEDIRRFEAKLDRLTSRRGAAMARDAEDRGLLWHAVSRGDAIATPRAAASRELGAAASERPTRPYPERNTSLRPRATPNRSKTRTRR